MNHISQSLLLEHRRLEEEAELQIQAELAAMRRRDSSRYAGMSVSHVLKAFEAMGFAEVRISRGEEGVVVEGVAGVVPVYLQSEEVA